MPVNVAAADGATEPYLVQQQLDLDRQLDPRRVAYRLCHEGKQEVPYRVTVAYKVPSSGSSKKTQFSVTPEGF